MTAKPARRGNSPALVAVREAGIEHVVVEFTHDASARDYGDEAVRALGCDPMQVFKTLVWQVDGTVHLAVVPVPTQVSPKRLAAAVGGRRAALADESVAERISGSVVGAISPLGMRRVVPVVVDVAALDCDEVYVSAGRRGVELGLNPQDLITLTQAVVAPISHD